MYACVRAGACGQRRHLDDACPYPFVYWVTHRVVCLPKNDDATDHWRGVDAQSQMLLPYLSFPSPSAPPVMIFGAMFMLSSSWNSILHAYGIRTQEIYHRSRW